MHLNPYPYGFELEVLQRVNLGKQFHQTIASLLYQKAVHFAANCQNCSWLKFPRLFCSNFKYELKFFSQLFCRLVSWRPAARFHGGRYISVRSCNGAVAHGTSHRAWFCSFMELLASVIAPLFHVQMYTNQEGINKKKLIKMAPKRQN